MPRAPQKRFVQPGILLGLQCKRLLRRPQDQQTARSENGGQHHDIRILTIASDGDGGDCRLPRPAGRYWLARHDEYFAGFRMVAIWCTTGRRGWALLIRRHYEEHTGKLGAIHFRPRHAPNTSYQAAARLVGREAGAFFGGGRSRSAGTWKRARNLCTIAMLSSFFPCSTSLTRLGVPRIGTMSARVRSC